MTTFVGAVWKFSLVLWSYILEPAEVLRTVPFVSLIFLKTKTDIFKKS